jgi:hypothetical protein
LLLQISPEDIQWVGEDPGTNHRFGGSGQGINRSVGRDSVPGAGRGRGGTKGQSKKDFLPSQNGIRKKAPDDIQILHTDTLVKEVTEKFNQNTLQLRFYFIFSWKTFEFLGDLSGGKGVQCKSS